MVYVVAEEREAVLMRLGDDRHLGYGDPIVRESTSGLRVNNAGAGKNDTMAVTVEPDKTATVERNW